MKITYQRHESLPRLAWCAEVFDGGRVVVSHGPWVEAFDGFFVEGAWDGDFAEGLIHQSLSLMGSGARIVGDRVVFCTASHTLERLHYIRHDGRWIISPSMPFVLEVADLDLDVTYIPYQTDLLRMVRTTDDHCGSIPLKSGVRLQIAYYRNLFVDSDGGLKIASKPEPPDFRTFEEYKLFLNESLRAISRNAQDPLRKVSYSPLTTISAGYDSAACAALARHIGCVEAVTLSEGRAAGENGPLDDSGKPIAEHLGMRTKEYDRCAYLLRSDFPEAEFVACGDLGQDVALSAFEDVFEGKMVLSGNHGDVIWSRHFNPKRKGVFRKEMGGCSLIEFKLRVGFIHVLPAFIGCFGHPSIFAISNSKEMAAWRVGGNYDRPIPRRLLEDLGVPRHLFGQKKNAVTVLLNRDGNLQSQLGETTMKSFDSFYRASAGARHCVIQLVHELMFALYRFYRVFGSRRPFSLLPCPIPERFREPPGRPSFLVHWAMPAVRKRYHLAEFKNESAPSQTAAG